MTDDSEQERIHEALAEILPLDGSLLTGWLLVWESASFDGSAAEAGHCYGPAGMTTWRAMGLAQWASTVTLRPDDED